MHIAPTALRDFLALGRRRPYRRTAVLVSLAAAGLLAGLIGESPGTGVAASQTGDCNPSSSWPANNGTFTSQVMSLINQHRAALGLGQLSTSATLSASAVWKARQMAAYGVSAFSHDDVAPPVADGLGQIATCGYGYSAGENIAEGYRDAQSVVNAWLSSSGHKANIENPATSSQGWAPRPGQTGRSSGCRTSGWWPTGGTPPPPPTTTVSPPPTTSPAPTTTASPRPTTTSTPPTTTAPAASPPAPAASHPVGQLGLKAFRWRLTVTGGSFSHHPRRVSGEERRIGECEMRGDARSSFASSRRKRLPLRSGALRVAVASCAGEGLIC